VTYTVVHARDVCVTDVRPIPDVGRPINDNARSVTCGACARAGVLPRSDLISTYIAAWAMRNGYDVTEDGGQYRVALKRTPTEA
jgi:hypothetical protein